MATTALVIADPQPRLPAVEDRFDLTELQIFERIPERGHGVAVLRGLVVVYETNSIHYEGIVEGAFYVRERQRPAAGMVWDSWLRREWEDRTPRIQPRAMLCIDREVVRAIRWPGPDDWAVRLASGHVDGPYFDWAFGTDFVGKVVGIYQPAPFKLREAN